MPETPQRRLPILLSEAELKAITEYRWRNRVGSMTEAARQLIRKGLEKTKADAAGTASASN